MDEQRYVVEITRPVPQGKVGQVAQRIAERLSVPQERIVTLLEDRVGAVTKPVLADKADAIAEVFAEAGVRVVVAAARVEPPQYEERFGEPLTPPGAAHDEDDTPDDDVEVEMDEAPAAGRPEEPPGTAAGPEEPLNLDDEDDVPWGQDVSWGFDEDAAGGWTRRPAADEQGRGEPEEVEPEEEDPEDEEPEDAERADAHEPYDEPGFQAPDEAYTAPYGDEVPEEEADRLGPVPGRPPSHDDAGDSGRANYAASTRWTPSPHDPYAFSPADSPSFGGKRPAPVGPAHTTPLSPGDDGVRRAGRGEGDMGFFAPEDPQPREGPQLRVYLLWALAVSLLVLILLQVVLAFRVDGMEMVGAYGAGLAAFRKGEFGEAHKVWEPLAEAGNADAQYYLGYMVQNGLGKPWSNARAANWYRRAAQQGHAPAQLALGDLYLRGLGVELDPVVGAAWYASAAVGGDPAGQFEYAKLLLHGVGVQQDMTAAYAWFEEAAANGVAAAADYVAYVHQNAAQ